MTVKEIPITNKQDWLENRLLDVTSTEVSCLFNLNPFKSEFQLYNEKKDKLVVHSDSERMKWGRLLEKSIAEGCAEQQGWDIEPFNTYLTNKKTRMGSSFDFKITSGDEVGIMEVKNVDGYIYRTNGRMMAMEISLPHQYTNYSYSTSFMCQTLTGVA